MEIEVLKHDSSTRVPRQFVRTWAAAATQNIFSQKENLRRRGQGKTHLEVVFVDAKTMKDLNLRFRGRDKSTDILSFSPAPHERALSKSLGELVVCGQVIKRQAVEVGWPFRCELGYLLVHGILHLLGLDHETSRPAARAMYTIQNDTFLKVSRKVLGRSIPPRGELSKSLRNVPRL